MNRELDRSIQRWLRAYPPAWRERNGDAMRGTLLDEATAAGTPTLSWPQRFDLLKGGVMARWHRAYSSVARSEVAKSHVHVASAGLALTAAVAIALAFRVAVSGQGLTSRAIPADDRAAIVALLAVWPLGLALSGRRKTARWGLRLLIVGLVLATVAYFARAARDSALAPFSLVSLAVSAPAIVLFSLQRLQSRGEVVAVRWLLVCAAAVPVLTASLTTFEFWVQSGFIQFLVFYGFMAGALVWLLTAVALGRPAMIFAALIATTPLAIASLGHAADLLTTIDDGSPGPPITEVAIQAILPTLAVAVTATALAITGATIANRRTRTHSPNPRRA